MGEDSSQPSGPKGVTDGVQSALESFRLCGEKG